MSKVDAQRAMKVARHTRTAAAPAARPTAAGGTSGASDREAPAPRAARATRAEPATEPGVAAEPGSAADAGASGTPGPALCGHRSMAGKECRRPAGHSEKSHRYS